MINKKIVLTGFCVLAASVLVVSAIYATGTGESNFTELDFSWKFFFWAVTLGGLSAISLPMGSIAGIVLHPPKRVNGALAAFGAGALFAALSIELVAPTMMSFTVPELIEFQTDPLEAGPIALIVGMVLGGILFVILDQLLNAHGGYLRKTATTLSYLSKIRRHRMQALFERLGTNEVFRNLPPQQMQVLVDYLHPVTFLAGDIIVREGEPGNRMFFLDEGEVVLTRGGSELTVLNSGAVLGEISIMTGSSRTSTAKAKTPVKMFELSAHDFERLKTKAPDLEKAMTEISGVRLEAIGKHDEEIAEATAQWARKAANSLRRREELPANYVMKDAVGQHGGAPLAIWLGIFLDGIPESFIIGATFLAILTEHAMQGTPVFTKIIPYTLIAGLFLSNFPEAMSSSTSMRSQGWSVTRVLILWISLMVMTAVGAGVGYFIGSDISHVTKIFIEGLAAGAMLTMIAQTMIPEAVHLGGSTTTGLSTLLGFLSAVAFKLLES